MSRIENLANAGLITKTGLVDNETAEAWTAEEMLANGTITKTGLSAAAIGEIAGDNDNDETPEEPGE